MRILISTSIVLFASALASQSSACDRHGGMFGQLSGATWTDYNPRQEEAEARFLEQQLSEWHKQNAVTPSEIQPAKPSFSKVSTRASMAAQARLAKRTKLNKQDETQASSLETSGDTSEMASR